MQPVRVAFLMFFGAVMGTLLMLSFYWCVPIAFIRYGFIIGMALGIVWAMLVNEKYDPRLSFLAYPITILTIVSLFGFAIQVLLDWYETWIGVVGFVVAIVVVVFLLVRESPKSINQ